MIGMKDMMIRLQTSVYMGEAQIHTKDYKENDDISNVITNTQKIQNYLESNPIIKNYSPRVLANAMLSSSYESQIVRVVGVDFSKEKNISKLEKALILGEYPKSKDNETTIILGHKLAGKLKSELSDKVILTFSEANSSDVSQDMFRVSAIVQFNMRPLDDLFVFIDLKKAQRIFGLSPQDWHEVALKFKVREMATNPTNPTQKEITQLGAFYESWGELAKPLKSMIDMSQYSMAFVFALVFIFILFAILNTMFMSIFERSFEFGVIKALGTRKWQVKYLILSECFSLGVLGSLLGILLGTCICYYLQRYGISYSGSEFSGVSLTEPIKPVFRLEQFTLIPLSVIGITILSGIYPAFYTAKIKASDAMRKSL